MLLVGAALFAFRVPSVQVTWVRWVELPPALIFPGMVVVLHHVLV